MSFLQRKRQVFGIISTLLLGVIIPFAVMGYGASFAHARSDARQTPVTLRVEDQGSFKRLIFVTDVPVRFKTRLQDGTLSMRFDKPVSINLAPLLTTLGNGLASAALTPDGEELRVRLRSPNYRIRQFTSDALFGLDLIETSTTPGLQTFMAVPFAGTGVQKNPEKTKPKSEVKKVAAGEPREEPIAATANPVFSHAPAPKDKPAFDERMVARKKALPMRSIETVPSFTSVNGRYTLSFPWSTDVSATVFRRDDYLWVVFDSYADITEESFKDILPPDIIQFVGKIDSHRSTLLRFTSNQLIHLRTYKEGKTWKIAFGGVPGEMEKEAVPLVPQFNPQESTRISIPIAKLGRTIKTYDPIIGDELLIITAPAAYHTEHTYSFVDMTLLETAQGMAVQLLSDGLMTARSEDGRYLDFVSPSGHSHKGAVSPVFAMKEKEPALYPPMPEKREQKFTDTPEPNQQSLLKFEEWKHGTSYRFVPIKQELIQTIALASDPDEKNIYRLELAQFYFAHGLYPEAAELIEIIRDNGVKANVEVQLLEGASLYLWGRYRDALRILQQIDMALIPELLTKEEVNFWINATKLRLGEEEVRLPYLRNRNLFLTQYPGQIAKKFALLSAEERVKHEDYTTARRLLDTVPDNANSTEITNAANYLLGMIELKSDNYDTARALWETIASDVYDRQNRAHAGLALTKLQYQLDENDLNTTIEKLDKLRAVWRGDKVELELLTLIGQLYIEDGQYLSGLRALREAISYYPEGETSILITNRMTRTFIALFNEGKARAMTPLEALSLYYEFRELTPIGVQGDKMIQSLAEWLVEADLTERAAALLTHQVKYRLHGQERSQVALRLAKLHEINGKYKLGLEALATTNRMENPMELKMERLLLQAKLMMHLKQYDDALYLLRNHPNATAIQIRAQISWEKGNSEGVIKELAPYFEQQRSGTQVLTPEQAQSLLRLAISYSFLGNAPALANLGQTFSTRLADVDGAKKVFTFVVDTAQPVDHRAFDETLRIKELQDFLKGYTIVSGPVVAIPEEAVPEDIQKAESELTGENPENAAPATGGENTAPAETTSSGDGEKKP
ncbi:MAG: hypothetical protein K0R63_1384 [Rickettsiales bacterium]|jgi:predicted negative regulator of RcsB-dependent stress response|nr:hypothetical protein [Rickettsiales bacterium]